MLLLLLMVWLFVSLTKDVGWGILIAVIVYTLASNISNGHVADNDIYDHSSMD